MYTLPKIGWSNVTNCQSIVDSLDPYQLGQFQKPQLFDDYLGSYIQILIAQDFPIIAPFYPVRYRFPLVKHFFLCLLEAPFTNQGHLPLHG